MGTDKEMSLAYVVLYDDNSESLKEEYKSDYMNRLNFFDEMVSNQSLGKINFKSEVKFENVKDYGLNTLNYGLTVFQWIGKLYQKYGQYDVIVFAPIYEMPWCVDGPSQGFNYNGTIFFCMETFFNPKADKERAAALMTHKFLHGAGFNHQDQMYKQYSLIDWYAGLPETNILLHGQGFKSLFLDKNNLKALGIIPKEEFEENCKGYFCTAENDLLCQNSWGPFCQDIDKDGIVDNKDEYVFSSPYSGPDKDKDGVVDSIDLCDNYLNVTAHNAEVHPLKITSNKNIIKLTFEPSEKIIAKPSKMIGGFIKFIDEEKIEAKNSITLTDKSKYWRVEVYRDGGMRPFYVDFGLDADFVYDREWYYFTRFGCDVPNNVDFEDLKTYDEDENGLPDKDKFKWANLGEINYDWDEDGTPDVFDTLPTIAGNCTYKDLKGLKDSDNDGLCDPGIYNYKLFSFEKKELVVVPYEGQDDCPYLNNKEHIC